MPPNTDISVTAFASPAEDPLLQRNQLLCGWLTDCLSVSAIKQNVWTSHWIESLRAGLRKSDSPSIVKGYQQLTEQCNNLLRQQYPTDEDTQNDWVSALLLLLLAMYVYRKSAIEYHHDQLVECPAMPWTKHATQVMAAVPKEVYSKQLSGLVHDAISKKPIDSTVDHALLGIHGHALKFYFKQLLNELHNTTQDRPPPDKENSAYKSYIHMICMLHVYITQLSTLNSTEKERLPNLLLDQLKQLIEDTSKLDLSPSWMDRLKQWIQQFFGKLKLLYTTISSATETSSSALLEISQQLQKSAKQAAQKAELQSSELIRERCWLYFSLYEQIIAQWWDKEKYALKYQSTALALFESFMSTFDWPFKLKKGILRENPLKSSPFKFIRKKATPEHLECLLDTALNKLRTVFEHYFFCWSSCHSKTPSFLRWLIYRHEPRLIAKIKDYISKEEIYFQQDEIPSLDKRNLYRLVQEIHEDFCKELNLITQMILSIWFQEIGIRVSHTDLASKLSEPGRWLYLNQEEPLTSKCPIHGFASLMLEAIGELGVGVYFFPPLQQRWSSFQEALAAHSGKAAEFVRQHDAEIAAILKKLFLMFHADHQAEAERNNPKLKNITQDCITHINSAKQRLQEFRKRVANEQQSIDSKTEKEATSLLRWLKYVVLYCVDYHVICVRNMDRLLSLSDDALRRCGDQKTYEEITKRKQREADTISQRKELKEMKKEIKEACKETKAAQAREEAERKEKEAAQAREEAERKEKEAVQAEVERLMALLAERPRQTPPQPSVVGSRAMFFSEPAASQATNNTAENPIFDGAEPVNKIITSTLD